MSRWLKSVNNLLEQLDGQVEEAVVDEPGLPTSRGAVDHVLSRRGLQTDDQSYEEDYDDESDEDYDDEWEEDNFDSDEEEEEEIIDLEAPASGAEPSMPLFSDETAPAMPADADQLVPEETDARGVAHTEPPAVDVIEPIPESGTVEQPTEPVLMEETPEQQAFQDNVPNETDAAIEEPQPHSPDHSQGSPGHSIDSSNVDDTQQHEAKSSPKTAKVASPPVSEQFSVPSTTSMVPKLPPSSAPASGQHSVASSNRQDQLRRSNQERKKAQAEARQLRKHVIALHAQLESVEAEMKAQREELQRAAERMERDRNRHNEEREEMMDEHDDELESQKEHYERLMEEQKLRHEEQIQDLRERLAQTEEMRMQEGGDWTKELEDAVKRERESLKKLGAVQDENSNLHSTVSKLETQLSALQNRLDSATQNAQNASQRERETEDKLDAALSLHSRQLSQRQAREAELERTVADLGAALVVARQKRPAPPSQPSAEGNESFKEQLTVALEELETLKVQLSLERQRSETLKSELQDISKERTEEALATQARQRQYDRQVADLTATVSRLQANLRGIQRAEGVEGDDEGTGEGSDNVRIARLLKEAEESKQTLNTLSEQLLRQQNLVESSKTEILTLKNRLKSANTRADNAEKALTSSANVSTMYEMDIGGVASGPGKLRRRIKGGRGKAGKTGGSSVKSIRSALNMEPGRVGEGAEQVAVTIDAIDSFMVETGSLLRHEPLARLGFFLYLVILHVWTFCLVIFHAHSYETVHGDFGSLNENGGVANGPDAIVQHSYR